ncbi:MAG: hypothetical protein KIS94_01305 [Chitinophagales bacterium]|nr:hypothetical protein [Chitinophagales bacterium]
MKTLKTFSPFLLFILLSLLLGEEHPFSRFDMYASFPTKATYYFLADENNNSISGMKEFSFSVFRIKDMMNAYMRGNEAAEAAAAVSVLQAVEEDYVKQGAKTYTSISLVKRTLELQAGKVNGKSDVIATLNLHHD